MQKLWGLRKENGGKVASANAKVCGHFFRQPALIEKPDQYILSILHNIGQYVFFSPASLSHVLKDYRCIICTLYYLLDKHLKTIN